MQLNLQKQTHPGPVTALSPYQPALDRIALSLTAHNSQVAYSRALAGFLAWVQLQGAATPLSRETVLRYQRHLQDGGKANATINLALAAIKKLAEEAMLDRLLDPQTERGISSIRIMPKQGTRLPTWLNLQTLRRLLELPDRQTPRGRRDLVLLGLMSLAGLRREECTKLQCSSVAYREGRMLLEVLGKGRKTRALVAHTVLQRAIDEWMVRDGVQEGQLLRRFSWNGQMGDGLTAEGVRKIVDRYSYELCIPFTAHDLRRTAARLMRQGGAQVDQIQVTLGHASVRTTELYLATMPDTKRPAVDSIRL